MFHLFLTLPVCFLHFQVFPSVSMCLWIILLKALVLAVTVVEHVACGRHNLSVLFFCASTKQLFRALNYRRWKLAALCVFVWIHCARVAPHCYNVSHCFWPVGIGGCFSFAEKLRLWSFSRFIGVNIQCLFLCFCRLFMCEHGWQWFQKKKKS